MYKPVSGKRKKKGITEKYVFQTEKYILEFPYIK
jgi:hypothetical protein